MSAELPPVLKAARQMVLGDALAALLHTIARATSLAGLRPSREVPKFLRVWRQSMEKEGLSLESIDEQINAAEREWQRMSREWG